VTVSGLFRNIPVRRNYLNSGRCAAEELKQVDNIVNSLAVIHPSLRVSFCHNTCLLWQKSACTSLCLSLMQVVGYFISSKLEELVLWEAEASVQLLLVCVISIFWKECVVCGCDIINECPVSSKTKQVCHVFKTFKVS